MNHSAMVEHFLGNSFKTGHKKQLYFTIQNRACRGSIRRLQNKTEPEYNKKQLYLTGLVRQVKNKTEQGRNLQIGSI